MRKKVREGLYRRYSMIPDRCLPITWEWSNSLVSWGSLVGSWNWNLLWLSHWERGQWCETIPTMNLTKETPITSVGCAGRDSLCCEQSFIPLLVPMSHDWKGDKWSIFCLLSIFNKCVAKAGILRLWWLSPEPRLLKNHTQFSKKLVAEGCNGSKTLLDPAFLIGSPWALMLQTQNLNR